MTVFKCSTEFCLGILLGPLTNTNYDVFAPGEETKSIITRTSAHSWGLGQTLVCKLQHTSHGSPRPKKPRRSVSDPQFPRTPLEEVFFVLAVGGMAFSVVSAVNREWQIWLRGDDVTCETTAPTRGVPDSW